MMTFLANIGSSTATIFKFIYLKFDIIKRKFRYKKIRSDHFLRSISTEYFQNVYDSNEHLNEKTHKLDRSGSNSKLDKKSSLKLSFKDETATLNQDSTLKPIDSKEKNLSKLNNTHSESKKSILSSGKDVKFEPVTQLIVDDVSNETKLLEATKRVENLIELNLENKFEQKETEFFIGKDPDDLDEENSLKTNQFLLQNIFE
jgi:hypothetical protein